MDENFDFFETHDVDDLQQFSDREAFEDMVADREEFFEGEFDREEDNRDDYMEDQWLDSYMEDRMSGEY